MKKLQENPIIILMGILASCRGVFAFFTDINSIFDFMTPNEAVLSASQPTPLPTATLNPSAWSGLLHARKPTLNEIRAEVPPSLWVTNGIDVRDMPAPGTDPYNGTVNATQEYLLPVYWCASSAALLQQTMDNIQTAFTVNGETVPEKYIFSYNYDTTNGWKCSYHAVVFGGWSKSAQYTLQAHRTLLTEQNDGQTTYPAGEYIFSLLVTVK